jgi:hypothetical protein
MAPGHIDQPTQTGVSLDPRTCPQRTRLGHPRARRQYPAVAGTVVQAADQGAEQPAADAAPKRGPGRPRKDAAAPTPAPSPEPTPEQPAAESFGVVEGDPEGTTYWWGEKHNTAARILPTESLGPVADRAVWAQLSPADYLAKKQALAEKFPTSAAPAPTPAPAPAAAPSAPTAAAAPAAAPTTKASDSTVSFQQAREALLGIAKARPADGRDIVVSILAKHGCKSVPELGNKDAATFAAVLADAQKAVA